MSPARATFRNSRVFGLFGYFGYLPAHLSSLCVLAFFISLVPYHKANLPTFFRTVLSGTKSVWRNRQRSLGTSLRIDIHQIGNETNRTES